MLTTEQLNPLTHGLAETLQKSTPDGLRMLLEVDRQVADAAGNIFRSEKYVLLREAVIQTLLNTTSVSALAAAVQPGA